MGNQAGNGTMLLPQISLVRVLVVMQLVHLNQISLV
jgi:hypothetical protein